MDSLINRLNVLLYSMFFSLLILCAFNYGTSYYLFDEKEIKTDLKVNGVKRFVYNRYIEGDELVLSVDLSYDMRKAFNWNLKQLFVYVMVTYKTPINDRNEVIIQDYIITEKSKAKRNYKNMITKYSLKDYSNGLRNNVIDLQVYYKYMPHIGFSRTYRGHKVTYKLPTDYFDNLPTSYRLYYPDK